MNGDDSLIGRNILSLLNAIYQQYEVALTYSNYLTVNNNDRTSLGYHNFSGIK
jgi:hypothetical protein